jgi:hypothetical protein
MSSIAEPLEPPLPFDDHIQELLSFTVVDHGPEHVQLLGSADVVKPCEVRSVVVTACDLAFVAQKAVMNNTANKLTLVRIIDDACSLVDADRNLLQYFMRLSPKKN